MQILNEILNFFDYKESSILTNATKFRINILRQVHENMLKMQTKSTNYQNKKIKNAFLLKKENKVFFFARNLRRKNKIKKLKSIKVETFFIKKIKKFKSYELNLFKNVKIHSIFNISLLKLIDLNMFIQKTFHYIAQKEDEFEVKAILK